MGKTYSCVGRDGSKARIDTVETVLLNYQEGIEGIWKTAFHPYRIAPQHWREMDRIDDAKEENGIGVPIETADDLYNAIDGYGDVSVTVEPPTAFGTQNLTVRTSMRTYRLEVDTDVVRWEP